MARIRSVHPSMFTDECWVSCSLGARLLFIGLWTDADDQGVFEWKPLQIKMRLLPGDNLDISALLEELRGAGLLKGFTEAGKSYGAIKDFLKFQRPKKPRAQFPLPADLQAFVSGDGEEQADLFGGEVPNRFPTGGENLNQMEGRGEERRMESEGRGTRASRATGLPPDFPDDDAIRKAEERFTTEGVDVDARREAEKFRNHHAAKGSTFKSWPAAWGTWTGNAIDYAKRDGRLIDRGKVLAIDGALPREEFNLRKWRTWMQDWLASPFTWDRKRRGPPPDEAGCEIPESVMAEFGHKPPPARAAR